MNSSDDISKSDITIAKLLASSLLETVVSIKGWVRTRRDSKGFSFIELNDGSCLQNLQIVAADTLEGYSELIHFIHTGCSIRAEGLLSRSPGKGQSVELQASRIEVIGSCDAEGYPLQKKRHSNEFLRTISHLRPRTNTFGAVFRVRSAAAFAVNSFFNQRGFCLVHTPIITASDCEGGGKLFQVTTLELDKLINSKSSKVDYSHDFFGTPAYLTVSGQLAGEAFACALGKIYTFGPTFRAENSNTPRHLAEFWMIEPEVAFADLWDNAQLAEDFIKFVVGYVLESCPKDMEFFDQWIEKGIIKSLTELVQAKFERLTYTAAIEILERSGKEFAFPVHWGVDLQTEHERFLTEEYLKLPVFVTNYPKEIKAFYMRLDEGERTVSAMDLLVPRIGEIIGGSQREEREDVLKRRMSESGLDPQHYEWYIDTRRFGTVPHAGFGLGFERLIMYLTGMQNIRDVIPFPRTPGAAQG